MKWWRKFKARVGTKLCKFGLWFHRKTACLAHEPEHFKELKEEEKKFNRLERQFRIQGGDLEVVKDERHGWRLFRYTPRTTGSEEDN